MCWKLKTIFEHSITDNWQCHRESYYAVNQYSEYLDIIHLIGNVKVQNLGGG